MEEVKYVTYKHLKRGQKVDGYRNGNMASNFSGYVKEANAAYVIVEMWSHGGPKERYPAVGMFAVGMSEEEIREKYNDRAGEAVRAIQNRLSIYEIGYHENWNAWLSSNPWELAQMCAKEKFKILGNCKEIMPKRAMFSGELLDIGVCAEDGDGKKFWCHFRQKDMEILVRRYEKYQEYLKAGNVAGYNDFLLPWT